MSNITLAELTEKMRDHDRDVAPGSESTAWGLFCDDAYAIYGVLPYDDDNNEIAVDDDFAAFWSAVADQDLTKAAEYGDVDALMQNDE